MADTPTVVTQSVAPSVPPDRVYAAYLAGYVAGATLTAPTVQAMTSEVLEAQVAFALGAGDGSSGESVQMRLRVIGAVENALETKRTLRGRPNRGGASATVPHPLAEVGRLHHPPACECGLCCPRGGTS